MVGTVLNLNQRISIQYHYFKKPIFIAFIFYTVSYILKITIREIQFEPISRANMGDLVRYFIRTNMGGLFSVFNLHVLF